MHAYDAQKHLIFKTHSRLWICIVIIQNLQKNNHFPQGRWTLLASTKIAWIEFSVKYISPIEEHLIHTHTHTHTQTPLAACISPQVVLFASHWSNSVWFVEMMDSDKLCKPVIKGWIDYRLLAGRHTAYISHPHSLWNIREKQEDGNKVEQGHTASLTNEW